MSSPNKNANNRTESPHPHNWRFMIDRFWNESKASIISCCWMRSVAPTLPTKKEIDCRKLFWEGFDGFYILFNMVIVSAILLVYWNSYPSYVHLDPKSTYFTIPACELNDNRPELERDCYLNTSHLFTDERIDGFVKNLHSIILREGCREGLIDKYNLATTFNINNYRPKINDLVVMNHLIYKQEFDAKNIKEAVLFVRTLENFLKNYPTDTVQAYNDGFVYINESLMEYCGYNLRPFKYIFYNFLPGCFFTYFVIVIFRVVVGYLWQKCKRCCKCCRHEVTAQLPTENI